MAASKRAIPASELPVESRDFDEYPLDDIAQSELK